MNNLKKALCAFAAGTFILVVASMCLRDSPGLVRAVDIFRQQASSAADHTELSELSVRREEVLFLIGEQLQRERSVLAGKEAQLKADRAKMLAESYALEEEWSLLSQEIEDHNRHCSTIILSKEKARECSARATVLGIRRDAFLVQVAALNGRVLSNEVQQDDLEKKAKILLRKFRKLQREYARLHEKQS
jgi:hypothetical protein